MRIRTNINELFDEAKANKTYLKVCAPMVRYSKLEFRTLVRKYKTDLCFTPMIMADSFTQSNKARLNEFSTNNDDVRLIAQFAAKNVNDFLSGSEMLYPYVDGVDLNCGCPQGWAMKDGYGSALLKDPETVADLVQSVRRNLPSDFSVSIKIRIVNSNSLSSTVDLARQIEKCGVNFISLHGRTPAQKTSVPVDVAAIREIKQSLGIPLIANGDIRSLSDADTMHQDTGCDGVMAARGMLSNPSMYAGYDKTPIECIQNWLNIGNKANDHITFQCFHHHLTFMTEQFIPKNLRVFFNDLKTKTEVFNFFDEHYQIRPMENDENVLADYTNCEYDETNYRRRRKEMQQEATKSEYNPRPETNGNYFNSQTSDLQSDDSDSEDVISTGFFD